MTQPVENSVYVAPSQTIPGAVPIRQILTFEFNVATGVFTQVNNEVIMGADPVTGLPIRFSTAEQMEDIITLLRANLRASVAILNALSSDGTNVDPDEFMRDDEEV